MNTLRREHVILALITIFCLILRPHTWAQTVPLPSGIPGAPTVTLTPTSSPSPSPTPTAAPSPAQRVTKYSEYKSICVQPEIEKKAVSEKVKEKRLQLIQEKLSKKSSPQLKALLIKEYVKQKNYLKAEELFKKEGDYLSESDRAVISADIDINKNLLRQAKNNLNKHLETHPKDIAAFEKLVQVYNLSNNYTEARMVLEDLTKLNLKKDYALELCESSVLNADHVYVKLYCEQLLKKNTHDEIALAYLGVSLRDQENYAGAAKYFKMSLKSKPNEFASTCLAETEALNKNYVQSILQYQESIKIKPDSKRAHLGLALVYAKNNQYREALEEFKISCKLGLTPLNEMSQIAHTLKSQKSNLSEVYFNEIQACRK